MEKDSREIVEAFLYVEEQLERRAKGVGGIGILAQQSAENLLRMLSEGGDQHECPGCLWMPKNIQEVSERAKATGYNFREMFQING